MFEKTVKICREDLVELLNSFRIRISLVQENVDKEINIVTKDLEQQIFNLNQKKIVIDQEINNLKLNTDEKIKSIKFASADKIKILEDKIKNFEVLNNEIGTK